MPRQLTIALIVVAFGMPLIAQEDDDLGGQLVSQGDYYFRKGKYHRAADYYLNAVLEEPMDGSNKLAHGHALFAEAKWSYCNYSLRRGLRFLGYPLDLQANVVGSFPSEAAFDRAMAELERYLGYYKNEPASLSVAAYMYFFSGRQEECRAVCERLLVLLPHDAFGQYFLKRLGGSGTPVEPPQPRPEVVAKAPEEREPEAPLRPVEVERHDQAATDPAELLIPHPSRPALAD